MFRYLLLFILLFVASHSFAQQDSSSIKHNSDSSIKSTVVGTGKYKYIAYTDANNTVLSREEIKNRLLSYQPSAEEYKRFKTARTVAAVSTGAAITSCIIGLIANKRHDVTTTRICIYPAVGFFISEIVCLAIAPKHFGKSIQRYNKQFL